MKSGGTARVIRELRAELAELSTRHGDLNIKCLQLEAKIKELSAENAVLEERLGWAKYGL